MLEVAHDGAAVRRLPLRPDGGISRQRLCPLRKRHPPAQLRSIHRRPLSSGALPVFSSTASYFVIHNSKDSPHHVRPRILSLPRAHLINHDHVIPIGQDR